MKKNQAFAILQQAGGARAARIITDSKKNISRINALFIAWQLRRGVPVAKIIHQKWFYGLSFYTNRHTLDPRPDTETLVEAVIADNAHAPKILDLGTGSGCIIAALVKNIPGATGIGLDISRGAVRVARRNVHALGLNERIKIIHKSFNRANAVSERFDIIVSNPPYIARGDTRVNNGAMHDPKNALYADPDGLGAYREIAKNARKWIKPRGNMYLEIGIDMTKSVRHIFEQYGWTFIRGQCDLGGIERVLIFQAPDYLK